MLSDVPLTAFPTNFTMLTGNPDNIDDTCNPDGAPGGIGYFYYKDVNGSSFDVGSLPQEYVATIGSHISFQDCWDGEDFTLTTINDHMTYSNGNAQGQPCPSGFPIKLPQIVVSVRSPLQLSLIMNECCHCFWPYADPLLYRLNTTQGAKLTSQQTLTALPTHCPTATGVVIVCMLTS
jgi:hypothetical protein